MLEEQWGGMLVSRGESLAQFGRDAEVLGHEFFKVSCLISYAADTLGDFSCPFLTCFRDWGYATCHVFLTGWSFVAGTHSCLTEKNMFSLTLFSCLAKAINFPCIRLL